MLKGTVTISENRYKEFLAMEARIEAFAAYVNTRKYDIEKKGVRRISGFRGGREWRELKTAWQGIPFGAILKSRVKLGRS